MGHILRTHTHTHTHTHSAKLVVRVEATVCHRLLTFDVFSSVRPLLRIILAQMTQSLRLTYSVVGSAGNHVLEMLYVAPIVHHMDLLMVF